MYFFLALAVLIGVPVAEIAVLIELGGAIGVIPTIALIFLTAILGVFMLRHQGMKTLIQAQSAMAENRLPMDSVVHGIFLMIAGAFLLTPGFITDALGFLLLIPPARLLIAHFLWSLVKRSGAVNFSQFEAHTQAYSSADPQTSSEETFIEGEYTVEDIPSAPPNPTSPWRDKK